MGRSSSRFGNAGHEKEVSDLVLFSSMIIRRCDFFLECW